MTARVSTNLSADGLRRFSARVASGLVARRATADKAAAWQELAEEALSIDVATKKGQDEVEGAWVVERFENAEWNAAIEALGARALLLSGDKPTQPPYETLFARVAPADVVGLGIGKTELGGRLVEGITKLLASAPGWKPLEAVLEAFATANERLVQAAQAREREEELLLGFELARGKLVRRINREADLTEAFVLAAFPKRFDLVRALFVEPVEAATDGALHLPPEMDAGQTLRVDAPERRALGRAKPR